MTVNVSAHDILHGVPQEHSRCPIARAIQRIHPSKKVRVTMSYIHIGRSKYRTSSRVTDFIGRFDTGSAVRPMRFELL